MSVTYADMRSKLLTLDQARTVLARTEPMTPVPFTVGDAVRFRAEPGWNHGIKAHDDNAPVGVYVSVGIGTWATEYKLTKATVEEVGLSFGMPRAYTQDCPAELLVPHLNYWMREGLLTLPRKKKDYQFLISDGHAVAFSRQGIRPFSNLALLEQAVAGIGAHFDTDDILVDYKMAHSLRHTSVRLVLPGEGFTMPGTGPADEWSYGLNIKSSLLGLSQTTLEGYLFRWVCTNGQIDAHTRSGVFTRRKDATDDEVNAWARQAVDEVFADLTRRSADQLAALTKITVEGNVSDTLRDIFEHYRIPIHHRSKIIKLIEEHDGEITMYVIMNAITQIANDSDLEASAVDSLMRVGGDLPYTARDRCGTDNPCGRLLHSH